MGTNSGQDNPIFVNAGTTITNGTELKINVHMVTMNIYISGDATASTCVFEGKGIDDKWYEVKCANLKTLTLATQTTGINEVWQVDLTAWVAFRVRVSAITATGGKSITIMGRVVN